MADAPIAVVLSKLEGVQDKRSYFMARCPSHKDKEPSLSIKEAPDRRVLLKCHAGCSVDSILGAIGLERKDLFSHNGHVQKDDWAHDYKKGGKKIGRKVRTPNKRMRWDLSLPEKIPYNHDALIAGVKDGAIVYLLNGEKAVEAMKGFGYCATCSPDGEGSWDPTLNRFFKGADVVIVADNDDPGMKGALLRLRALQPIAGSIRVVKSKTTNEGDDSYDHLKAGYSPVEFVEIPETMLVETVERILAEEAAKLQQQRVDLVNSDPDRYGRVVSLANIQSKEIKWLLYPYLAEGFSGMVDGEKGIGKSFLLLAFAAGISVGKLPGIPDFKPGKTLILASEDPLEHVVVPRLRDSMPDGADMSKISVIEDCPSFDHGGFESLEVRISDIRPRLVIIDMLFGFTGDIEVNSDPAAKACMRELNRICATYQCAMLLSRHPVKNWRDRDYTHRGMGSQGWGGGARLGFWVEEKDCEPGVRIAMHIKANIAPELGRPIRFTLSKSDGFQWDGWDEMPKGTVGSRGPSPEKQQRAKEALIRLLTGGSMACKDAVLAACEMSGASSRTVYKAAKALGIGGDVWTIEPDPFGGEGE